MATISYPLDITGLASSNLIQDELQTITEVNSNTYRILIPKFAPFYLNNLVLKYVDIHSVETTLEEHKDYFVCLPFIGGARALGKLIYGAISINNKYIAGTLKVTYQALGGPWAVNKDAIISSLIETQSNPKTIAWDLILDKPNQFAPSNHQHHIKDIYSHRALIDAINGLKTVITSVPTVNPALTAHMADYNNPHQLTAAHVGLDKVVNLPMATDAEVLAQAPVDKYVTMKQFVDLLNALTPKPPTNTLPTGTVLITGNQPMGSTLTATNTLADADGLGTFKHQWYSGATKVGTDTTTYTTVASDVGNVVTCAITYTDGKGNNESVTSNSITVTAALVIGAVIITGNSYVGQVLGASNTLSDTTPPVTYTWYYGPISPTNTSIALGTTHLLSLSEVGKDIYVEASYTNTSGVTTVKQSSLVRILAAANNVPTGGVTITGNALAGSVLTVDTSKLVDADGLGAFSYQWKAGYIDIAGATSSTYTTVVNTISNPGDLGKVISCTVSYTDGVGNAESVDSDTITVTSALNSLPTGTVTINGILAVGNVLSLTNTIADTDGLGIFHYQWKSGTDNVGTDAATYTTVSSDTGKDISCIVSYIDSKGNNESVTSNLVTILSSIEISSPELNDEYGRTISINSAGTIVAIGAPHASATDTGAVYIASKGASGWSQTDKLVASNSVANDWFGNSVSLDATGSKIIIGATGKDDLGDTDCGAHYYFTKSGATWTEKYIAANGGGSNDFTGSSVALARDGVYSAVGSYKDDGGATSSGSILIYQNEVYANKSFDGDEGSAYLGWSSAISAIGDRIVSGQYGENYGSTYTDSGSVKVFFRTGTTWAQEALLRATDKHNGDYFGWSVAINDAGNIAVIGAPGSPSNGAAKSGAVYIFTRSATTWTEAAKITTTTPVANGSFGTSVAINASGDKVVIGESGNNKAYLFTGSGATWTLGKELSLPLPVSTDQFGSSVAIDSAGSTVAVGAVGKSAVYVFNV